MVLFTSSHNSPTHKTSSTSHIPTHLRYQESDDYAASSFPLLKTLLSLQIVASILELCLATTCVSLGTKACCSVNHARFRQDALTQHKYPILPMKLLSSMHIFIGIVCLLLFAILFTLSFDARHSLTCEEVYCGLLFIGIGVFGFYTLKRVNVTSLTPFMVLNIFGFIFAGLLLCLALVRVYMFDKVC